MAEPEAKRACAPSVDFDPHAYSDFLVKVNEFPFYRPFGIQTPAVEIARASECLVFALDKECGKGKKSYVATGLAEFWRRYRNPACKRCFYEMLMTERPTKMYMDMDMDIEHNQQYDGEQMAARLKEETALLMQQLFGLEATVVIESDSTNASKFSRHLTYLIPGRAFAAVNECGAFYRRLEKHLIEKYGPVATNPFWISRMRSEHGEQVLKREMLADHTVYTRYRLIRCMFSSKLNQNRYLIPKSCPDRWRMPDGGVLPTLGDVQYGLFVDSLTQYFREPVTRLLYVTESTGEPAVYTSMSWQQYMSKQKLAEPMSLAAHLQAQTQGGVVPSGTRVVVRDGRCTADTTALDTDLPIKLGSLIASEFGNSVSYYWHTEGSVFLSFDLAGRFCQLAQREHGSNHPRMMVFLPQHKGGAVYYQHRCHCDKTYKSRPQRLKNYTEELEAEVLEYVAAARRRNTFAVAEVVGGVRDLVLAAE